MTLGTGAALVVDHSDASTISGNLSGPGSLVIQNTGMPTLTGTNTYLGGTTLAGPDLSVTNSSALGSGTLHWNIPSTLAIANTAALTLPNNFSLGDTGTYAILKSSASSTGGTLTELSGTISGGGSGATLYLNTNASGDYSTTFRFSAASTYRATIFLNRGCIEIANATSLGDPANQLNMASNSNSTLGTLRFSTAMTVANPIVFSTPTQANTNGYDIVLSGVLSGSPSAWLSKLGGGALIFAGHNTFAGLVTIYNGSIQVGNGGTTGTVGSGSIQNNATLAFCRSDAISVPNTITGAGSIVQKGTGTTTLTGTVGASSLTINSGALALNSSLSNPPALNLNGGTLALGNGISNIGSQTVSALTQSGGTLALDISGATADSLTVNGAYACSGGSITVNIAGIAPVSGVAYPLVSYNTLSGQPNLSVAGLSGTRYTWAFDYGTGSYSKITVTFSGSISNLMWSGANGSAWDVNTSQNWLNAGVPDKYFPKDSVVFDDSAAVGSFNVSLNTTTAPGAVTFNNNSQGYTLTGSGSISGTCNLTMSGSATSVIATNNNYSGTTTITAGTLQIGNSGTSGTLGSGNVTVGGTLVFDRSDAMSIANVISGAGSLVIAGGGSITLTSANSYQGTTTLQSGTLIVGNASCLGATGAGAETIIHNGGALDINGYNLGSESLQISGYGPAGSGAILNTGSSQSQALRFITLTGDASIGGTNRWDMRSSALLALAGHTLTKTGANSIYLYDTTVGDGNLIVDHGSLVLASATIVQGSGSITVNPTATLETDVTGSTNVTRPITLAGGTLIGNAGNEVIGSTITLAADSAISALSIFTLSGPVGESGGSRHLSKTGSSSLTLAQSSTFSGGTSVIAGTLIGGATNAFGSGLVDIATGAAVQFKMGLFRRICG